MGRCTLLIVGVMLIVWQRLLWDHSVGAAEEVHFGSRQMRLFAIAPQMVLNLATIWLVVQRGGLMAVLQTWKPCHSHLQLANVIITLFPRSRPHPNQKPKPKPKSKPCLHQHLHPHLRACAHRQRITMP